MTQSCCCFNVATLKTVSHLFFLCCLAPQLMRKTKCKTCHLCKWRCQKSSDTLLPLYLQDHNDAEQLLAPANVDYEALCNYACDAADFSTGGRLPDLQFAQNHAGQRDVAMFDFTCMHRAENASLVKERRGKKLLIGLVGDCLVEVGSSNLGSFPLIHILNNAR